METWRDHKRYLWLVALLMPLIPFMAIGLFAATGWDVWLWLGPIVILGAVPVIDLVTGTDTSSPPDEQIKAIEQDKYYRWITFLFLPLQYAGFILGFWYLAAAGLTMWQQIGLAITIGFIGGLGINTAHELGHKKESHERWLSKIALAPSAYGHFYIEHNRGHHVRVATPDDPASSRVGESFYRFWPRTVFGSLASAWQLEKRRYARRNQRPFHLGNDVLNSWLMTLALWLVMAAWLGWQILPFLALQALVAISLLEAVNYLEHYGMMRSLVTSGEKSRYERVNPTHSWNSNHVATNVLLYHLQRHSDHHAHPTRRYQALRDYETSPSLPTGYAGMILLALVPPLWRSVMDSRVAQHFGGSMERANIAPYARTRVLAAWPSSLSGPPTECGENQAQPQRVASVYLCTSCGYTYDERIGDEREGFPAGTRWSAVPDTWACPDCGVREKIDFVPVPENAKASQGAAEGNDEPADQ